MNLPIKVSQREKRFLIIGGVIIIGIVLFELLSLYGDAITGARAASDSQLIQLEKELHLIARGDNLSRQAEAIKEEIKQQKRTLLSGEKPPVAAAELQSKLEQITTSQRVEVKLERALKPIDIDFYLGIPVEVGFVATTDKLKEILFMIRTSNLLLSVSELKVNVRNISKPADIYTTLKVTGFIVNPAKKPVEEEGT